jgi:hypothetical protein
MAENDKNVLHQVQEYRKLVLLYESLDAKIDALIMEHNGAAENMSSEDRAHYRHLAQRRDEVQNQMRQLEQELLVDDDLD